MLNRIASFMLALAGCLVWAALVVLLVLFFVYPADAQTVTSPRIPQLTWDWNAEFDQTYPSSAGPLAGQRFIQEYRIVLTPTSGGSAVIVSVPIAQVEKLTPVAACAPRNPPCLRVLDVAAPFGTFTLGLTAVSREGAVSDLSNTVPFAGTGPRPAAPAFLRQP